MTRAEFIKNIGIGAVLLLGGGVLLQWFGHTQGAIVDGLSRAYGINTYGGSGKRDSLQ